MPLRILIAYSTSSAHVQTTLDYLWTLKRYTDFEVSYVHVTHDAVMDFDINDFGVVFHNYCAHLCFEGYVSQSYREAMKRFRGLKILAVQDEYDRTNVLKAAIKELGFHVVLTCVPQDSLEYVYPRQEFPETEFLTVLTGYVPDDLAVMSRPLTPLPERSIVIGYRGRAIRAFYGQLSYEKYEIGRRMREVCLTRGIPHDIAMDEESRIYGTSWFDFVGSCRSMLGSESGSNVFDFDGSIENQYNEMAASRGGKVDYEEFLPLVAHRESEISMGQVSSRIFECAVFKTPLILFRGRYSDLIEPGTHYLPLEKNFSNVDEVIASLGDIEALQGMAERTYQDLVGSGRFGFRAYGHFLKTLIERKFDELRLTPRVAMTARRPSNSIGQDAILNEQPTDRPFGKERFDLIQCRHQISILGPEIERLSKAFNAAMAAHHAETARLTEVCQSEIERLWGGALPATASILAAQSSADSARNRLTDFVKLDRNRRARFESKWNELPGPHDANIDPELQAILGRRLEILQCEIKTLSSEIDQLNAAGQQAVSTGATLVLEIERKRLSEVFDKASAAYLTEAARLTEACKTKTERLWRNITAATASAQSSVEASRNRLIHFTELCQTRRARFDSEWNELSAQPPLNANIASAQRLERLESEIESLRGEIDQLNTQGREAVAAAVGWADTIARRS